MAEGRRTLATCTRFLTTDRWQARCPCGWKSPVFPPHLSVLAQAYADEHNQAEHYDRETNEQPD